MKKFYRFAILIFIGLFVFANTSCSFFGAIGKIFVNVRNGNSPAGQNSFIMSAYLFDASEGVSIDDNGNGPQIDRIKAKDLEPGQEKTFSFDNPVREGTRVKVVLCLKTKNTVDDNNPTTVDQKKYYKTEATIVVHEGVNELNDFPVFTEVPVDEAWWYMD